MPLQINISENEILSLNRQAKDEFESSINDYITEVLNEASRIEAANNSTGRTPEITSSMINDAVLFLKRGYKKPKKSLWFRVIQIISAASSAIFGVMFDYEKLTEPVYVILLFCVFATALATTTFLVMNE